MDVHRYENFILYFNIFVNVELKRKISPAFLCIRESERYRYIFVYIQLFEYTYFYMSNYIFFMYI